MCPHRRAQVLSDGIIGDGQPFWLSRSLFHLADRSDHSTDPNGNLYVACPLHKRQYSLDSGDCINDSEYKVLAFEAREEDGKILLLLPPGDQLDALIGSAKWMVRQATAQVLGGIDATKLPEPSKIEIIGPSATEDEDASVAGTDCESGESHKGCGGALEW